MSRSRIVPILISTVITLLLMIPVSAQRNPPPTPFADACIPQGNAELPALNLEVLQENYATIEAYLSAGGNLDELEAHLESNGMLLASQFEAASSRGLWSADVDGDRVRDVVLNITLPPPDLSAPPSGDVPEVPSAVVLYRCIGGQYEQASVYERSTQPALTQSGLTVEDVEDLTGDGSAEIAYHTRECGAHTCFLSVNVLTWNADTLMDVLSEPISFPQGSYELTDVMLMPDMTRDGNAELVITTGMISSVGAGPQRAHTLTYDWQEGALILVSDSVDAPRFRFEVIADGVNAHSRGFYNGAIATYDLAINNEDYEDFTLFEDRQIAAKAVLISMARFGTYSASAALYGVDAEETQAAYESLLAMPEQIDIAAGADTAGDNLWRWYGVRLHEELASGASLADACAEVSAEVQALAFPDNPYWSVAGYYPDLGYANTPPQPQDLCNDLF